MLQASKVRQGEALWRGLERKSLLSKTQNTRCDPRQVQANWLALVHFLGGLAWKAEKELPVEGNFMSASLNFILWLALVIINAAWAELQLLKVVQCSFILVSSHFHCFEWERSCGSVKGCWIFGPLGQIYLLALICPPVPPSLWFPFIFVSTSSVAWNRWLGWEWSWTFHNFSQNHLMTICDASFHKECIHIFLSFFLFFETIQNFTLFCYV